jgi:uncharacterized membrane protein
MHHRRGWYARGVVMGPDTRWSDVARSAGLLVGYVVVGALGVALGDTTAVRVFAGFMALFFGCLLVLRLRSYRLVLRSRDVNSV